MDFIPKFVHRLTGPAGLLAFFVLGMGAPALYINKHEGWKIAGATVVLELGLWMFGAFIAPLVPKPKFRTKQSA